METKILIQKHDDYCGLRLFYQQQNYRFENFDKMIIAEIQLSDLLYVCKTMFIRVVLLVEYMETVMNAIRLNFGRIQFLKMR